MGGECPIHTGAGRPAGPNHGRAGIDGNPQQARHESIVDLFMGPGGTAPYENEPAGSETAAKPRGGRRQNVVAEAELRRNRYPVVKLVTDAGWLFLDRTYLPMAISQTFRDDVADRSPLVCIAHVT
jgi:hypothetical protein